MLQPENASAAIPIAKPATAPLPVEATDAPQPPLIPPQTIGVQFAPQDPTGGAPATSCPADGYLADAVRPTAT